MRRRDLLPMLAAATGAMRAQRPARPNIVLILADDLGPGDLGRYGQTKIRTPHLDRMAAEGTRFGQAYAGSSVCAPSRCSGRIAKGPTDCPDRGSHGLSAASAPEAQADRAATL